ncbi:MAG: hypothetical protein WA973_14580 [Mesorhizobium sp.]
MAMRDDQLQPYGRRCDTARHPATSASEPGSRQVRRPRCADVACNRAQRYASRRRIAIWLWPLLAMLMFVGLIVERRPFPAFFRREGKRVSDRDVTGRATLPDWREDQDIDRVLTRYKSGSAINGGPSPQYRPPADFLATRKEVMQIVSFLIRNRGKLDTDPVRMKWRILDRASLPLAIFLREIESNGAWDDLETEIADAPFEVPTAPGMGPPKSIRHRKILRLMPEWVQRGEDILSPEPAGDDNPAATPDIDKDDPDKKPPKP